MPLLIETPSLFLFVPADRPDRYAGALESGADAVVIDLEDAVAAETKSIARSMLVDRLLSVPVATVPVLVRVNGAGTSFHADDLAAVSCLLQAGRMAGVMLPKAESAGHIRAIRAGLALPAAIVALVETAAGLALADEIAGTADRIAFGSVDFAADIGCDHSREALLHARSRLVIAARAAGMPAPIDGVTRAIRDEEAIESDARHGAGLGLKGKLLIHPAQIAPARRGFAPTEAEVAWSDRVLAAMGNGAAVSLDGQMVDAPVIARARQIRNNHDRTSNGHP
ncbi:HpcH/HpaI aldolase/citrate lyase family protein [Hoeflea marina]|nr:CoA ester lyase [Hoeflea marina]